MAGAWRCRVVDGRPFTIHGDAYWELAVVSVADGAAWTIRVPAHAVAGGEMPAIGSVVEVTFLLGQVTGVVGSRE